MDISGWTIEQRMRLPEWCYGMQNLYVLFLSNWLGGTRKWLLDPNILPDPACIFGFVATSMPDAAGTGDVRFGLNDTLPTNQAEMDASDPIFPTYGIPAGGPNYLNLPPGQTVRMEYKTRYGFATTGKKLVMELSCGVATVRCEMTFMIGPLPTDMAGWLAHSRV